MKKKLILLLSILTIGYTALSQPGPEDRIPERMSIFIRKRMQLTEKETEQFQPLFARYQKEWREVMRKNREDRLLQQKELIELQLRYRSEFGPVVGEKRVMQIYHLQDYFIRTLRDIQRDRKLRDREHQRMGPPPPPPPGRNQED